MRKERTKEIYDLLESVGLSRPYVRSLLPSWWDEQAANNPAGLSEFKLMIARNFGIDVEGLSSQKLEMKFKLPHARKLKRSIIHDEVRLQSAISIGLSAARIAIASCSREYVPLPSPSEVRRLILEKTQAKYVSLRALLKICWEHGIPVLHISHFPSGMAKMDGLATLIGGRPAIVLSKLTPFRSWMSFILAHEMGHLAQGHCSDGGVLIDEMMDEDSFPASKGDPEEDSADQYAFTLLSGEVEYLHAVTGKISPDDLARSALEIQRTKKVDAGHVLLKYAYRSADWRTAIASLKLLDTDNVAIKDISTALTHELNFEAISESSTEFLLKLCGVMDAKGQISNDEPGR